MEIHILFIQMVHKVTFQSIVVGPHLTCMRDGNGHTRYEPPSEILHSLIFRIVSIYSNCSCNYMHKYVVVIMGGHTFIISMLGGYRRH